jgi:hypothetical protein
MNDNGNATEAPGRTTTGESFAMVPESLVYDPRIGYRAKVVYAALVRHRNSETGVCRPGFKRLSELLKCSTDSVGRDVRELAAAGYLEVERGHGASRATNSYRFPLDPQNRTRAGLADSQNRTPAGSKTAPLRSKRELLNESPFKRIGGLL